MAISLEELKRQHALMQQHLEWLDAKIRELSPEAEKAKAAAPELPKAELAPKAAPDEVHNSPKPKQKTSPPGTLPPESEPTYHAQTQDELLRAKVGCFLFFVLGIVLFLFLLFGLPYYL